MSISDAMKKVFLDSYKIYEMEREFNYQNWGKYPYRDRKNSIQIVADFNANAYSVNGLFVNEETYTQVYPPQIIETIEQVLVEVRQVFLSYVDAQGNETSNDLVSDYQRYQSVIVREFVEVEATEIQTISYLFPFSCVPDSMGRLRLSL